ncbi:MAG TPA: hypothetical protein VD816_17745 [Ohtaekwangia sp.]|nr:hypothetical protein [Ohtaekwangia sp.]
MTKRDFFRIILKIFGLYFFIHTIFTALPNNLIFSINYLSGNDASVYLLLWILLSVIVTGGLFILLIFQADKIIALLKLDTGYDQADIRVENFNDENIIKLGSVLIGGLLITDNVPVFLSHLHTYILEQNEEMYMGTNNNFGWITSVVNIFMGYLLLSNYQWIGKILKSKQKPS